MIVRGLRDRIPANDLQKDYLETIYSLFDPDEEKSIPRVGFGLSGPLNRPISPGIRPAQPLTVSRGRNSKNAMPEMPV